METLQVPQPSLFPDLRDWAERTADYLTRQSDLLAADGGGTTGMRTGNHLRNLLVNGDAEGEMEGVSSSLAAGATIISDPGESYSGGTSFKLDRGTAVAGTAYAIASWPVVPVKKGQLYEVSLALRASTATPNGVYVRVNWLTAAETLISSTDFYANGAAGVDWGVVVNWARAPSTARKAYLQVLHNTESTAQSLWVDEITFAPAKAPYTVRAWDFPDLASAAAHAEKLGSAMTERNIKLKLADEDYYTGNLSFTKRVSLQGCGPDSRIILTSTVGDGVFFDMSGIAGVKKIDVRRLTIHPSVVDDVNRNCLRVRGANTINVGQVDVENTQGKCLVVENCPFPKVKDCQLESASNTCLMIWSFGGAVIGGQYQGNTIRQAAGSQSSTYGPPVYVTGTVPGMQFQGNKIGGAGPRYRYSEASIVSDPGGITITIAGGHSFNAGDIVIIHNSAIPGYNTSHSVSSKTATTLRIDNAALNLGPTSGVVVTSRYAGLWVDNTSGSVNECQWQNNIFEAITVSTDKALVESYAMVMDATRSGDPAAIMYNHIISGNTFDTGFHNFLAQAFGDAASRIFVLTLEGNHFITAEASVQIIGGVDYVGLKGNKYYSQPQWAGDGSARAANGYPTYARPFASWSRCIDIVSIGTRGPKFIDIDEAVLGASRDGTFSRAVRLYNTTATAGVIDDVKIKATAVKGQYKAIDMVGGYPFRLEIDVSSGTHVMPTIGSAATIDVPLEYKAIQLTGAAAVSSMTGVYPGRTLDVLCTGGPATFAVGGPAGSRFANAVSGVNDRLMRFKTNGDFWFVHAP